MLVNAIYRRYLKVKQAVRPHSLGFSWVVILALLFVSFPFPDALTAQEKENAEFKLAVGLYNDGMNDLAAEQLKNFINAYPNSSNAVEARFYLGTTQMNLKRFDDARVTFQNFALAYVEHPKAPEAWLRVGDAFIALGNVPEAASAYERVKVFHPKSQFVPDALLKAGQLYRQLNDRENAKKNLRTIIQEYPSSRSVLPARLAIGEMYAEEGQTELAEREARRVAEGDAPPDVKASAIFSIGKLQMANSLFSEAGTTFKSVIANHKKSTASAASVFELARLAAGNREYAAAVEYLKNITSNEDDSLQARGYFEMGLAHQSLKDFPSARQSFDKISSKFPKSSLAERSVLESGRSSLLNGDAKSALKTFKKLIVSRSSPGIPAAYLLAADASASLKQHDEASRYLLNFIREFPDDLRVPASLLRLGKLCENDLGEFRKGINFYDQLAQKYPQSPFVVYASLGIASCQEKMNDHEGALRTYNDLQTRFPANDSSDFIRVKIDYLQNHKIKNRDAGIEKLARLMGEVLTEKNKADLSFKLGEIYFSDLKDYESAAAQFGSAIDNGISPDKLLDAQYYRAKSYRLLSEVKPAAGPEAIRYYEDLLPRLSTDERADEISYSLFKMKTQAASSTEIIAESQIYLSKHPSSGYWDEVLFGLAKASAEAGAHGDAISTFGLLIKEYPKSARIIEAYFELGILHQQMRHPDSSEQSWLKAANAAKVNPFSTMSLLKLADLYVSEKKYSAAIGSLKSIVNDYYYSASSDKASSMLPEIYVLNGEYDEAIALYSDRLAEAENTETSSYMINQTIYYLASALDKKGDRQKAIQYYNKYLTSDRRGPYASNSFYALGKLAQAQGKLEYASSYFKNAAALGEGGSTTGEIADLLFQTEQYGEAARQYSQLAASADSSSDKRNYQFRTIVSHLRNNNLPEAQKLMNSFIKNYKGIENYKAEFEYESALVYYRKQDYETAKKIFENVADDYDETRFGAWGDYYLGKISELSGKPEEAVKKYDLILKDYPGSEVIPRVLLSLGNMHFNAERYEQSIRYYQEIIKFPGKSGEIVPYAMNNLIEAYESTKLYDEALKVTRDFIQQYPANEAILDKKIKLGMLYTKVGYYDQAVLHFQNLIPEAGALMEAEIRYNIGEAYYYKGDYQQAILEFLKVPYLVTKQGKVDWTATSLYMAGQSYEKMSKFSEAISIYQQVIDRPGIDQTFKAAAQKEINRVRSIINKEPR